MQHHILGAIRAGPIALSSSADKIRGFEGMNFTVNGDDSTVIGARGAA
jgi:hypothetical protein